MRCPREGCSGSMHFYDDGHYVEQRCLLCGRGREWQKVIAYRQAAEATYEDEPPLVDRLMSVAQPIANRPALHLTELQELWADLAAPKDDSPSRPAYYNPDLSARIAWEHRLAKRAHLRRDWAKYEAHLAKAERLIEEYRRLDAEHNRPRLRARRIANLAPQDVSNIIYLQSHTGRRSLRRGGRQNLSWDNVVRAYEDLVR